MDLSLQDKLLYITARITAFSSNQVSRGTGFLFAYSVDSDNSLPVLITNKHVIVGFDRLEIVFSYFEEGDIIRRKSFTATIDNYQGMVIPHPNTKIDLCGIAIGSALNVMRQKEPSFNPVWVGEDLIPSIEVLAHLNPIEDVTMIGYPAGLYDHANESPLIRRGITSTPVFYDFNGAPEFLVDMSCVPGSSGSPVFLLNQGAYAVREGGIALGNRLLFLGVQHAGPTYEMSGRFKAVNTTEVPIEPVVPSFINLGYVIKSSAILEMKDRFIAAISEGRVPRFA